MCQGHVGFGNTKIDRQHRTFVHVSLKIILVAEGMSISFALISLVLKALNIVPGT